MAATVTSTTPGKADWTVIKKVKEAVAIPVIGNGDIFTAADAVRMARLAVDGLMIGRGVQGNPWLVRETVALSVEVQPPSPTVAERFSLIRRHLSAQIGFRGEEQGIKEMRKHLGLVPKRLPRRCPCSPSVSMKLPARKILRSVRRV